MFHFRSFCGSEVQYWCYPLGSWKYYTSNWKRSGFHFLLVLHSLCPGMVATFMKTSTSVPNYNRKCHFMLGSNLMSDFQLVFFEFHCTSKWQSLLVGMHLYWADYGFEVSEVAFGSWRLGVLFIWSIVWLEKTPLEFFSIFSCWSSFGYMFRKNPITVPITFQKENYPRICLRIYSWRRSHIWISLIL